MTLKDLDDEIYSKIRQAFSNSSKENQRKTWFDIPSRNVKELKSYPRYRFFKKNGYNKIQLISPSGEVLKIFRVAARERVFTFDKKKTFSEALLAWLENGEGVTYEQIVSLESFKKLLGTTLDYVSTEKQKKNLTFVFKADEIFCGDYDCSYSHQNGFDLDEKGAVIMIYRRGVIIFPEGPRGKSFDFNADTLKGWDEAFSMVYDRLKEKGVVLHMKGTTDIEKVKKAKNLGLL